MKRIFLLIIILYQYSPLRVILKAALPTCRFYPSCSSYTHEAVGRYGVFYGFWLGLLRLLRCHPFSKGGLDLVPKGKGIRYV